MLTFKNCVFAAQGTNKRDKVYGLKLEGSEEVSIKNCSFESQGYSALLNNATSAVTIEKCTFNCGNNYNPIEGSQTISNGDLTMKDCSFLGVPGNNFINFYNIAANSIHTIQNCSFAGATNNNIIRLSNRTNATATFNIYDCEYSYINGTPDEYTGFILCQDYTNKSGAKQDFSTYTIDIKNLNRPEVGSLVYVYEDGVGIIDENYPTVYLDGVLNE